MNSKTCSKCNATKLLTEFNKDKRIINDGCSARCKDCRNRESREYYKNNPEKKNTLLDTFNKAIWNAANAEKCRAYRKKYNDKKKLEKAPLK